MFVSGCDVMREVRLRGMLERALLVVDGNLIDLPQYLNRLASCQQMTCRAVRDMYTSINPIRLPRGSAKSLGAVVTEIVHFVDRGVPPGECAEVYLAVGVEDRQLVAAMAVTGDYRLVACAEAMAALARASRITGAMGGTFCRGEEPGRMLFGLIFPIKALTPRLARTRKDPGDGPPEGV